MNSNENLNLQNLIANYNEFVDQIFRFIYLKTSNRETAEDLTSDCFMSAIKYMQTNRVDNVRAFLYKIARNKVIDHYREKGRVIYSDEVVMANEDTDDNDSFINRQDARMASEAMKHLDDSDREVLTMRYIEDLPMAEIGKILGKNTVAIRVQIFRALRKMRAILNNHDTP
jgi:RNA polymerase sigma-70 factor (ECF subfamily)